MYTDKDLKQFASKSISEQTIDKQIASFKKGFPYAQLEKPAISGDGIMSLSDREINDLAAYYDKPAENYTIIKFVPASGAASRMFKSLYEYLEKAKDTDEQALLQSNTSFNSAYTFIHRIKDFAFYNDLRTALKANGYEMDSLISKHQYSTVIDHLVNNHGLGYGSLPKGLLKFHTYDEGSRLALGEHLVEAAEYCRGKATAIKLHFTVSPEHLESFKSSVSQVKGRYEDLFDVIFEVSYSVQKPSTDTIAVDMNNIPFREPDGSILFRPGGHGALIENLSDIDGNIVFIKNIDNVVPDRLKPETIRYKKTIGGLLMQLQTQIHEYLRKLSEGSPNEKMLEDISAFARHKINIRFPSNYSALSNAEKTKILVHSLNRPIRVCGMVKNEGEPGGGPFWVKNTKGETSLQIVESSQIDMKNERQKAILEQSTHFNPVDLVCGLKDFKGNDFALQKYVDPQTGFISVKSKGGKNLKAQELPGLWNGAMADWITLFVEVPIITFNPVKTVNDLLRPQHQPA